MSEVHYPDMTDWVLWVPYTLAKEDQRWFYGLDASYRLNLWNDHDVEMRLRGEGVTLRETYFGELVVTPDQLAQQHRVAVSPIRKRWLEQVHHPLDAERKLRRILGQPDAWEELAKIRDRLAAAAAALETAAEADSLGRDQEIRLIESACRVAVPLLKSADNGIRGRDVECVSDALLSIGGIDRRGLWRAVRRLRAANIPCTLVAHNALDDVNASKSLLERAKEVLREGLVAVLAQSGGGKTQLAAQLTAPDGERPAGVLLHGARLRRGGTIDDFIKQFKIHGNPATSVEHFLAAIDAAGVRSGCRLPVVIDGLNESENPSEWKAILSELGAIIRDYTNVVVICTLRTGERTRGEESKGMRGTIAARESFAVMALPEEISRIDATGFGADVGLAVQKYFTFFRIDAADADIPTDFMSNPLNLRIFCETQNPRRDREVKVQYFPLTLSSLFDKYVDRVCEGVANTPNAVNPVTEDEVRSFVHKLGWEMWISGKREVEESRIRSLTGDAHREWNSSIVNLLAQEGLVMRDPGREPGEYMIAPAYDELGGHLIGSGLLAKHRDDREFSWLRRSPANEFFARDNTHVLASSIFRSLVALCPARLPGVQLWRVAPQSLRSEALLYTTGVTANRLDSVTVHALRTELMENDRARQFLFRRLSELKAVEGHPLNSGFLGDALRGMSVAERDLSWGEWIRSRAEDAMSEILTMEARWREGRASMGESDTLRMKWAMWHLVTTDRRLRDLTTRAIYWYGRGDARGLFNATVESLGINDMYVKERMLAASYGAGMAIGALGGEVCGEEEELANFGKDVFDNVFAEQAPFGTTHVLAREYGRRIVELAASRNRGRFTRAQVMSMEEEGSPVSAALSWGENYRLDRRDEGSRSPFQMDFENYTMGRLVPGRNNYDYSHDEYRKVRAQILWRVEDLGWTYEGFGDVDSEIGAEQWRRGRSRGESGKVERYGKKYSWVGYYELAGLRKLEGKLGDNWESRVLLDIDPSFPENRCGMAIITEDFLGDRGVKGGNWVSDGPVPEMGCYLEVETLGGERGPWVALDGSVSQDDPRRERSMFCFLRSVFVAEKEMEELEWYLEQGEKGGEWFPVKRQIEGVFGGEMPWCDAFGSDGRDEFGVAVSERKRMVKRTKAVVSGWDDNDEDDEGHGQATGMIVEANDDSEKRPPLRAHVEWREVCEEVIEQSLRCFEVELPVCDYLGCAGSSVANVDARGGTLAKRFSLSMELVGRPQTLDLFTKGGERVTYNTADGEEDDWHNHQSMFFVRKDILEGYLKKRGWGMIWGVWGERNVSVERLAQSSGNATEGETYSIFGYVRRYRG